MGIACAISHGSGSRSRVVFPVRRLFPHMVWFLRARMGSSVAESLSALAMRPRLGYVVFGCSWVAVGCSGHWSGLRWVLPVRNGGTSTRHKTKCCRLLFVAMDGHVKRAVASVGRA